MAVDKRALIHAADTREKYADERKLIEKFTRGRTATLAVHLLTPEGEPLTDKEIFRMQSADEVLTALREAVTRFGPVKPRRVQPAWQPPDKGIGVRSDGSRRLALAVRYADKRDDSGRVVFDSIILSSEQWRLLVPNELVEGSTYEVDAATVRELSRAISPSSDLSNTLRPIDIGVAKLTGKIQAWNGGFVVRFSGELRGERKYVNGPEMLPGQLQIDGVLFVSRTGQVERLLLVGSGSFRMPWDRTARPTVAIAEWLAKR